MYSIFEPHTDLINRGKMRTPVEFGHKVFLAESAKGLITQYEVLKGNPTDEVHVAPSLKRYHHAFRRAPELYAGDRGFFTPHVRSAARAKPVGTKPASVHLVFARRLRRHPKLRLSIFVKSGTKFALADGLLDIPSMSTKLIVLAAIGSNTARPTSSSI
jgi:IS5 family transposase